MTEITDKTNVEQVQKWTQQILKNQCAGEKVVDVKLTGTTEKGDGYIGDIIFATITTSINGSTKQYEVVLKLGKMGNVRTNFPIRKLFEREIYFYTEVVPCYREFSEKIVGKSLMDMVPECYGAICDKDREIIFIKNLSKIGYRLHDRRKPMDLNHIKSTLKNYGKFHAVSFAMRDQEPERFKELCQKNSDHAPWNLLAMNTMFQHSIEHAAEHVYKALEENEEFDLLEQFKTWKGENDYCYYWHKYLNMECEEKVLSHGDCWNNNFMFKYEDDKPTHCYLLDYQLSTLTSPVLDLCYHLSCVTPNEILSSGENFVEILNVYYDSLVENLKILGSDAKKLFSYETFLKHLKSVAPVGMIFAGMLLPTITKDKGAEVQQLEDLQEGEKFNVVISDKDKKTVHERLIAVVKNVLDVIPNV